MFDETEMNYEKRPRAGMIPYTRNQRGELIYRMMVASDPIYGGPKPMISKGKIEDGEEPLETALREAKEELGLYEHNLKGEPKKVADERVRLRSGTYHLTVYAVEINNRLDFGPWEEETAYTEWMTLAEFKEHGRKDHYKYLEKIEYVLSGLGHFQPD